MWGLVRWWWIGSGRWETVAGVGQYHNILSSGLSVTVLNYCGRVLSSVTMCGGMSDSVFP